MGRKTLIPHILAKLAAEGIDKSNYTTEKAEAVLSECVGAAGLLATLRDNERSIRRKLSGAYQFYNATLERHIQQAGFCKDAIYMHEIKKMKGFPFFTLIIYRNSDTERREIVNCPYVYSFKYEIADDIKELIKLTGIKLL